MYDDWLARIVISFVPHTQQFDVRETEERVILGRATKIVRELVATHFPSLSWANKCGA